MPRRPLQTRWLVVCAMVLLTAGIARCQEIIVVDQSKQPIPGAKIELSGGSSAITDENGKAHVPSGRYDMTITRDGFETLKKSAVEIGAATLTFTLTPATHHETVNVQGAASGTQQGASSNTPVPVAVTQDLSNRPATVADALPLVPGIARTPSGALQISAAGEHHSAMLVNSADVTDPATGQFGPTVPIDEVQSLNVYQTPFLAEYGTFTAGLVSVETRRGGDKWKWELRDPFPEFRIRSWDLVGLRAASPRPNFQGPIIPGKLYISGGFLFNIRKTEVYELPFPANQKKVEGENAFIQLDWVVSDKQLVTATLHVAPQSADFVNMDFFNPQPTTPDSRAHNYAGAVADHWSLGSGVLDTTLSTAYNDSRIWGQGPLDLTMTPAGNSGNYFAQQSRNAYRYAGSSTYSFAPVKAAGSHNVKLGVLVNENVESGQVIDHPIDIMSTSNVMLERIAFTGGAPFRNSDTEFALFAQDHWNITPRFAVDAGLRLESQEISGATRLAPRAGVAWSPFAHSGTVIRAGVGRFYDRVPLNVYSFSDFPREIVTPYVNGVAGAPILYLNTIGEEPIKPPFVFGAPASGRFSPRSTTGSLYIEQPVSSFLKLRLGYLEGQSAGLVTLDPFADAHVLSGSGQSRYRQAEITAKVRFKNEGSQLFISYVHSRARGDLNDFNNFLGDYPAPILRPDAYATLPTDMPNRFLLWGLILLPYKIRVAPTIEYRSGFPVSLTDQAQNYFGFPDQSRFPGFFSADLKVAKDFKVSPKYSVRPSVSGFNLTNHNDPEAFHNNLADPGFGLFFGHRGRRFTADFDVIF